MIRSDLRWPNYPITILGLLVSLISGCVTYLYLPGSSGSPTNSDEGRGRTVSLAIPFADERVDRDRCGAGHIVCDQDPAQWIAQQLRTELRDSGFKVLDLELAGPGTIMISGVLTKFHVGSNAAFSLKADIHTKLSLSVDGRETIDQSFLVSENYTAKFLDSRNKALNQSILAATRKVVLLMGKATIEFSNGLRVGALKSTSNE